MSERIPNGFVARMLAGHAGLGVALAALLYILSVTGTLVVFHPEWTRWEQPHVPEMAQAEPGTVERLAEHALAASESQPTDLRLRLPTSDLPRLSATIDGQERYADADGNPVAPVHHPWRSFLRNVHFYLNLPTRIGLTLVGALGALMAALVISGILAHPRIFRDAFRMRLGGQRLIQQTDAHNRIGAWAAPFHLAIAISGAVLGLSLAVSMTSQSLTPGQGSFFDAIFDTERPNGDSPSPLPAVAPILKHLEDSDAEPVAKRLTIYGAGGAGPSAKILAQHPDRLLLGEYYHFTTAGELHDTAGLSDGTAGQQAFAAMYPLHFASFGGLPVRLAYAMLGLLAAVMVATGGNIWLLKRRRQNSAHPHLERAWAGVVWGTPVALGLTLAVAASLVPDAAALTTTFWLALVLSIATTLVLDTPRGRPLLQGLVIASLIAAVFGHVAHHGIALPTIPLMVNLALTGSAIAVAGPRFLSKRHQHADINR